MMQKYPHIDLERLIEEYPELAENVVDGVYDFSKSENQYQLAERILDKYFELKVNLSRQHLCPRIPNRLEYIKFCEHLVEEVESSKDGWSIDVGTGSSIIYPLLGIGINRAHRFIGTEIDETSLCHALGIVESTGLGGQVKLLRASGDVLIPTEEVFQIVQNDPVKYVICNPPFYKSAQDVQSHEAFKSEKPNQLVISSSELYTPGGEVQFVQKLIDETCNLAHTCPQFRNTWFTAQIGIHTDLVPLHDYLQIQFRNRRVSHFLFHDIPFKTSRWVAAWNCSPWRPPVALSWPPPPSCLPYNHKMFLGNKVPHNLDVNQIYSLLEEHFSKIDATRFRFSLHWNHSILYVDTNEPVWLRKTCRALKFDPTKLDFSTRTIFKVAADMIVLVYGNHLHLRSFYDFLGRLAVSSARTKSE